MRARIRAGDREAFAALYEEYARAVYNHAYRLTGDWSTAEEVLSETFLAAWRTRQAIEPEGDSLRPWLLGIATNKARNANRGRGRRLAFLARRPAPEPVADIADATAGRVDDARRLAAVQRALGGLRRQEREVLVLCVWSGLDYAEAAEALGVPVGTVRSRLSRARTRLRRLTDDELGRAPDGPAREARGGERGARSGERGTRGGEREAPAVEGGAPAGERGAVAGDAVRFGREPRPGRGEVESRAAFVALPIQEEAR
ncbi:RNA polymerase sigma factor [Streptomyces sp. NPDC058411]|uniref:RNA polymerase sigma factor n=1 Tax=Streptomyces sp. NPDC058411 TaxID=3346485 RepID=UPI00364E6C58